MGWIFAVTGVLLMAFGQYRRAKQQGVWRWGFFLGLLGAIGLFVGLVIVPLCRSNLLETNPNLLVALLLGGGLVFVASVIVVARRVSKDWVVK